jgi:hypothetical protein
MQLINYRVCIIWLEIIKFNYILIMVKEGWFVLIFQIRKKNQLYKINSNIKIKMLEDLVSTRNDIVYNEFFIIYKGC